MKLKSFAPLLVLAMVALTACSHPPSTPATSSKAAPSAATSSSGGPEDLVKEPVIAGRTNVLMHNVMLTERPGFRLRVRWLRGEMYPTRRGVVPSFDDPGSFIINIEAGVIATSFAEISALLNERLLSGSPLKNISLAPDGERLKLTGTLHKGLSLPVEMRCEIAPAPEGRIRLHVLNTRVLKMPVGGLMHAFDLKLTDIVGPRAGKGVEVSGNDLYIDADQVVPAPALRGNLTKAHVGSKSGDLITVFGEARPEVMQVREWRNFIRLYGGSLNFGKLTMHHADLFLIDASQDEWFDFDLTRYQEQLVNGRIQMTPQAGLRVFMPDIQRIPTTAANRAINLEWMKNRNLPPPADITP